MNKQSRIGIELGKKYKQLSATLEADSASNNTVRTPKKVIEILQYAVF